MRNVYKRILLFVLDVSDVIEIGYFNCTVWHLSEALAVALYNHKQFCRSLILNDKTVSLICLFRFEQSFVEILQFEKAPVDDSDVMARSELIL